MKKLYTLALVMLVSIYGVKAQEAVYETSARAIALPTSHFPTVFATVNDTLMAGFLDLLPGDVYCNSITIYCAPGGVTPAGNCRGGYRTGNNQQGDLEKLTKYRHPSSGKVLEVFIRTAGVTKTHDTTLTYAVAYGVGSDGLPDTNDRTLSTAVPMSDVQDGGNFYSFYEFPNPHLYVDSFFVGLVLPTVVGDTVGIFSSKLGGTGHAAACAANYPNRAYERRANGSFNLMKTRWNMADIEMIMATVIQFEPTVATKDLLGRLVKVAPIPATSSLSVTLPANIKGATTWQILSSDGKVVRASTRKTDAAFMTIDRGNLPAGVYTLRLNTAGGPANKRIIFAD